MDAGKLDRRIQFSRATLSDDGFSKTPVFGDLGAPVWASRADVSDGERQRSAQVEASVTARFLVRWSGFTSEISPADRLVCDGRDYDILWIKEVGRRRFLEISARARVAG